MMRIPIRIQLGSLLLLSSLIGLAVLSVAVWITVHNFVLTLRGSRIASVASLKAAQLVSNLDLLQTSASFVGTRVLIQSALTRYNEFGNDTAANWVDARDDMAAAVGGAASPGQAMLLQAQVFPRQSSGPAGVRSLLNVTGWGPTSAIELPYTYPNGTPILLGADNVEAGSLGYPPRLYPNLTYTNNNTSNTELVTYQADELSADSVLVLGPWMINDTFALASFTVPVINVTMPGDVLGWLTVVVNAELIVQVMDSKDGTGETGETLFIGPTNTDNLFYTNQTDGSLSMQEQNDVPVRFVLPLNASDSSRHPQHVWGTPNAPFNASQYPAVLMALAAAREDVPDDSGSSIYGTNEEGRPVSVGYAMVKTRMVDWIIIVEFARAEIWQPIHHIRDVILACLFAVVGFMIVVSYPLAHFASIPILRLRKATQRSVEPPSRASASSLGSFESFRERPDDDRPDDKFVMARKEGFQFPISRWRRRGVSETQSRSEERRKRAFRIPGKVEERKHWIRDELSDLTMTFNEMSDELMMQYSKLEERVQQRTAELELSKKAAEAANESKTLFIANISHELKTPLNGILGMCAVCMQEDDPIRLKRSLGIIYKSGDLLLNLLTDLLTFSKNQVGQHLTLDEKEFRLRDVSSQTMAIFEKQAKESQVDLKVEFEAIPNADIDHISLEPRDAGLPGSSGKIRDMILWGDVHRILQVVINLISNALKFTPAGGSVVLTVRCLPDAPELSNSRKSSFNSKQSWRHSSRQRYSDGTISFARMDNANSINVSDRPGALAHLSERAASPPPGRYVALEFEVTDTGPGISETFLQKIFEPFVQGDLGLSKKYGGTGLGLSICSQLASLMRGTINVHSTVGVGSTFTLRIPIRHLQSRADSSASSAMDVRMDDTNQVPPVDGDNQRPGHRIAEIDKEFIVGTESHSPAKVMGAMGTAESKPRLVGLSQPFFASSQPMESPGSQPAAMEKITADATRGGKIRVLVAEDNKVNQEVVLRMLKLEDIYDVTVAKDGQEALDLVKESMGADRKPFNLIFMDVQMPNVDGIQSTRLIREIGYQAPIVALTAFAEDSNIKDCLDSGMNYFLSKPIRRPQLKKVLKEYCTPILEEDYEDVTPPEVVRRSNSHASTTIVMVNSGPPDVAGVSPRSSLHVDGRTEAPALSTPSIVSTSDDARPISPRTAA